MDKKLIALAEKARKQVGRSVLPVSVAKSIAKSVSKSSQSESAKKTIQHLVAKYNFDSESKKILKQSLKSNVPSSKKPKAKKATATKTKARNLDFWDEDGDETISFAGEEVAPTPEYHELIELDRYAKSQQEPDRNWKVILILLAVALLLVFVAKTFMDPKPKSNEQVELQESHESAEEEKETVTLAKEMPDPVQEARKSAIESNKANKIVSPAIVQIPATETLPIKKEKAPPIAKLESVSPLVLEKATLDFPTRRSATAYLTQVKIPFQGRSLEVGNEALVSLANVALALKTYPEIKLRIKGHTCSVGEADENQVLSENRALLVFQTLVNQSVNPTQLNMRGYGERDSIASDTTSEGRRQNRRVDFMIIELSSKKNSP